MLFSRIRAFSLMINFLSSLNSVETSSRGRDQFSVENAYMVKALRPRLSADLTISDTTEEPRTCPHIRGRKRLFAQRPFPSIITAICFGRLFWSNCSFTDLTQFNRMVFNGVTFSLPYANFIFCKAITHQFYFL